jgi:hypothetical protein
MSTDDIQRGLTDMRHPSLPHDEAAQRRRIEAMIKRLEYLAALDGIADWTRCLYLQAIAQRRAMLTSNNGRLSKPKMR